MLLRPIFERTNFETFYVTYTRDNYYFRRSVHRVYAKAKDSLDGGEKEVGSATRIGRSETVRSCDGPRVDRSRSKTPPGPRGIYLRPRSHHPQLWFTDSRVRWISRRWFHLESVSSRVLASRVRMWSIGPIDENVLAFPFGCFTSLNKHEAQTHRIGNIREQQTTSDSHEKPSSASLLTVFTLKPVIFKCLVDSTTANHRNC